MSSIPLTLRVWPQHARHVLRQLLWLDTRNGLRGIGCSGGCSSSCCCASRQQQGRGLHGRDVTEWEHADTLHPQSRGQRQFNARVERALTSALHTNLHLKAALVDSYGFAVQAVRSSKDRKRAAVLWSCSPQAEEACAAALQRYGGRVRAGVAAALGAPMVPALDYRHAALAGEQRRAEELLDAIGREAADGGAGQGAGVEEAKGHRGAPLGGQVLERELGQGRAEEDDTGERPPAGDGRRRGSELMGGSSEETSRGLGVGLRRDNVSVGESRGGGGGDGGVPADALDAAARSLLGGLRPKPRTRGRRQGT